jgi:four helix bundle protein
MDSMEIRPSEYNLPDSFSFENWAVYKKALAFCGKAYGIRTHESKIGLASLFDQIRRAATSIPLNISEGYSRVSKRDKQSFLRVALGSTYECAAVLDVMKEIHIIEGQSHVNLKKDLIEIASMIGALIKYIEKNDGRFRK